MCVMFIFLAQGSYEDYSLLIQHGVSFTALNVEDDITMEDEPATTQARALCYSSSFDKPSNLPFSDLPLL